MAASISALPPHLQRLLAEAERLANHPRTAAVGDAQPALPLASIALWHADGMIGTVRAPQQAGGEDTVVAMRGMS